MPDAGMPKAWVDAAREALKKNERPSFSSGRLWELSGSIVRCGCCGWAMATTTVSSKGLYYRCRKRSMYSKDICGMNKYLRADLVEPLVCEGVSEILAEPEKLRRGLQKMLEREQEISGVELLDLTVEAHPDGRLVAAWALNASVSKIRGRSRQACVLCR